MTCNIPARALAADSVSRPLLPVVALSIALLALGGCADTADTFPLNDQARAMGPLRMELTRTGMGFAPVTATLGDGETLKGTVRPAFGGSFSEGFAAGPQGTYSATAFTVTGGNAQMTLNGPKTQLLCRGSVSVGGHGSGECRTYEGAAWTISY